MFLARILCVCLDFNSPTQLNLMPVLVFLNVPTHTQTTIFRLGILIHINNYCLWCFGTTFGAVAIAASVVYIYLHTHTLDKMANGTVKRKEQKRNLDLLTTGKRG